MASLSRCASPSNSAASGTNNVDLTGVAEGVAEGKVNAKAIERVGKALESVFRKLFGGDARDDDFGFATWIVPGHIEASTGDGNDRSGIEILVCTPRFM